VSSAVPCMCVYMHLCRCACYITCVSRAVRGSCVQGVAGRAAFALCDMPGLPYLACMQVHSRCVCSRQ
jgi:hypothetical protein